MLQMQLDTNQDLEYIFKEEISVYKSLLLLETNKKESILQSKGKDLEAATKQITHLLTIASEVELRRRNAISRMFAQKNIQPKGENIVLSEFLDHLEEAIKPKFKVLAEDLRKVVGTLREKVLVNEKLLKAKQEIFQLSMEALKIASGGVSEVGYEIPNKQTRSRTSIVVNAKV